MLHVCPLTFRELKKHNQFFGAIPEKHKRPEEGFRVFILNDNVNVNFHIVIRFYTSPSSEVALCL